MVKIAFITTDSVTIPWHLQTLIRDISKSYELTVIGNNVSRFSQNFDNVSFVDIRIERKISFFYDLSALTKLSFILYKLKPHIVHSFFPKAGFISSIASIFALVPLRFHTFTGQIWLNEVGFKKFFLRFFDKVINALNTACLTDSTSQSNLLRQNGITFKNKGLKVLGSGSLSGVDINSITYESIEKEVLALKYKYNLGINLFIYCYLARKTKIKGALDILKAFQIVNNNTSDVKLFFIGPVEDELFENLKTDSPSLFANVIDIGAIANKYTFLLASDVLCVPSIIEGFGTVVLDAAAVGRPSIGYRIVGLVDSISDNNTGLLSDPSNILEFANHMLFLKNNIELTKKYGNNARVRAKSLFDSEIVSSNLNSFYLDYLDK